MSISDVLEEKMLQTLFDNSVSSLAVICQGNQDFLFRNIAEIKKKQFPFLESVAGLDATLKSIKEQLDDGKMSISDKSFTKELLAPISEISSYIDKLYEEESDAIEAEDIGFVKKDLKLMDLDHLSVFSFNRGVQESILNIHQIKLQVNRKYDGQVASLTSPKK